MSIQAVSWALGQQIPGTAKLVLIALANRADHETGHCWPSVDRIAKEASCSPRSVHTYIGALRRNGYVDVRSGRSKAGTVRTNDYWLLMDRRNGPWDFGKGGSHEEHETQDVDDQSAAIADTEEQHHQQMVVESDEDISATAADFADGISATRLQTNTSILEPSESLTARVEGASHDRVHDPPRSLEDELQDLDIPIQEASAMIPAPIDFDANSRQSEIEMLQAAEAERAKNQRQFVFKGTKAWQAWCQYRKKKYGIESCPETWHTVKGKQRQGWWFQTLFPPPEAV